MIFEPIDFDRQGDYLKKLSQCSQIASDYSFINLWGWREAHGLRWAWHDGLVWIQQTVPESILWAPVGNWAETAWTSVMEAVKKHYPQMIRIPEALIEIWQAALPDLEKPLESREHWDYLLQPPGPGGVKRQ